MIAWYTADASSGLADLTEDGNAGEADDDEFESAAFDCLQALLAPIEPYRGRRREAERFRKLDRAALMLAEGGLAWAHYAAGRTRRETTAVLRLSVRQLRTHESLIQRAIDYFQLAWTVGPAFRGRPVLSGWKPATGGRPGTRRHLAAQLGVSERMPNANRRPRRATPISTPGPIGKASVQRRRDRRMPVSG